jgi:hypothetical protein
MNEPQSLPFTVGTGSFWDILAPQERKLIEKLEADEGRQFIQQEIELFLSEAHEKKAGLTPEERKLIEWVEWDKGRQLTKEEITLDLEQAREIGNL